MVFYLFIFCFILFLKKKRLEKLIQVYTEFINEQQKTFDKMKICMELEQFQMSIQNQNLIIQNQNLINENNELKAIIRSYDAEIIVVFFLKYFF